MKQPPGPPTVTMSEYALISIIESMRDASAALGKSVNALRPAKVSQRSMRKFLAWLQLQYWRGRLEGSADALLFYLPPTHEYRIKNTPVHRIKIERVD